MRDPASRQNIPSIRNLHWRLQACQGLQDERKFRFDTAKVKQTG
jgi:hypothetical protein